MMMQRNAILGTWELASFTAHDQDTGEVRRPLGATPAGIILYTADGYMSAQLATAPCAADYIAYCGRFHLDEKAGVLHHEVTMATLPELLATPQYRDARLDDGRLILSATVGDAHGVRTHSTLIWQRPGRSSGTGHS